MASIVAGRICRARRGAGANGARRRQRPSTVEHVHYGSHPSNRAHIAPDANAVRAGDIERRSAFLDALVVWLSKNFDLPARFEHPTIKFVPAQAIAAMRYAAFLNDPTKVAAAQGDVVAVYNTEMLTIYLRDD